MDPANAATPGGNGVEGIAGGSGGKGGNGGQAGTAGTGAVAGTSGTRGNGGDGGAGANGGKGGNGADGGAPAMWRSDDAGRTWRRLRLNTEELRGTEPGFISGAHLDDGRVVVVGSVDAGPAIWSGQLR